MQILSKSMYMFKPLFLAQFFQGTREIMARLVVKLTSLFQTSDTIVAFQKPKLWPKLMSRTRVIASDHASVERVCSV